MADSNYSISRVCKVLKVGRRTLEILEEKQIVVPRIKKGEKTYNALQIEEIVFAVDLRREMGVNWAGVEVALEMRKNMKKMMAQMEEVLEYLREQFEDDSRENNRSK